jgi:hypothetical protein
MLGYRFISLAGERFGRLAEGLPKKFGEGASGTPAIYSHFAISVIGLYCFQVALMPPIKRPLSRKNTSPTQKMKSIFLQGQYPVQKKTLFVISHGHRCRNGQSHTRKDI